MPADTPLPSEATTDVLTLIERAEQEVAHLCTGVRRWTMCVPVQKDDSDMVISDALRAAAEAITAARSLPAPPAPGDRARDDERLDYLLRNAVLTLDGDGESLCLFLGLPKPYEGERPALVVAGADEESDEWPITERNAPFLSEDQRAHINGSIPKAMGEVNDPAAIRAAIDYVRRDG